MNNKHTDQIEATPQEKTPVPIQCWGILLIASNLRTVTRKLKCDIRLGFHFQGYYVDGRHGFSTLDVRVERPSSGKGLENRIYVLTFTLRGVFIAFQDISTDEFNYFLRQYSIPTIIPYAREYASDQFRRTGISEMPLPIINTKILTEMTVEGKDFVVDTKYEKEK